jgi:hypothetical protein
MAPMVVQVRDGQVVIRQGHCRHRAFHWLIKFAKNGVKARLIKFVLTSFVARMVKQNFLTLKVTINFRFLSLLRLSPCIACTTARRAYEHRRSLPQTVKSPLPMFVNCSKFTPPRRR